MTDRFLDALIGFLWTLCILAMGVFTVTAIAWEMAGEFILVLLIGDVIVVLGGFFMIRWWLDG